MWAYTFSCPHRILPFLRPSIHYMLKFTFAWNPWWALQLCMILTYKRQNLHNKMVINDLVMNGSYQGGLKLWWIINNIFIVNFNGCSWNIKLYVKKMLCHYRLPNPFTTFSTYIGCSLHIICKMKYSRWTPMWQVIHAYNKVEKETWHYY